MDLVHKKIVLKKDIPIAVAQRVLLPHLMHGEFLYRSPGSIGYLYGLAG